MNLIDIQTETEFGSVYAACRFANVRAALAAGGLEAVAPKMDDTAADALDRLAEIGIFPYDPPAIAAAEKKGALVEVQEQPGRYTHLVVAKTAEELADEYKANVPTAVTMRQARTYLHRIGMLAAVTDQVTALGGEAQIAWEYSQEVQRNNPFVAMLGFTEEQLDAMFTEAAKL